MAKKETKQDDKKETAGASDKAAGMPLFYSKPVPLDAKKHATLALKKNFGLNFTKGINAVPINLIEMPQVCHFYPIAFSPDQNATPVAIMGVRNDENLFLNKDGSWNADAFYIPAYIRRYPFIFSEMPGGDQLSLCLDMNDDVIEDKGEQKFFTEDGKPTPLAQNALEFCKSYHAAARQTLEFSKWLVDNDMLVEREAQINTGNNTRINFSGFKIVDEKKLGTLDDKKIAELHKKGWLPFIYAHLFSGAQWQRLTNMLRQQDGKKAA